MWEKLKNFWKADNLLKEAWSESFEMLNIGQEMFVEAQRVLRQTKDNKINEDIRKKDKLINKYERQVRKKVLTHLSVQSPFGLPEGMVLVSIVVDIERLGDYAKNIVELAIYHPDILKGGKFEEDLLKIEDAVKNNFMKTKDCIVSSDQDTAIKLLKKYKWVNPLCDKCIEGLVAEKDKKLSSGQSAALALYIRWLKRLHSHLRNITTSVVNPFHRIGFKPKLK
jgi:phosphate transport system protein